MGLPPALVFVEAGFRVFGFDVDPQKIARLERGESYIRHIGPERVGEARAGEHPGGDTGSPASPLSSTPPARPRRVSTPGQLVMLESTTYPGTTEEEVRPLLRKTGLRTGAGARNNLFLAFSPEREDPGNPDFSTRTIPKLVGGVNPESTHVAAALYGAAVDQVVPLSSPRVSDAVVDVYGHNTA